MYQIMRLSVRRKLLTIEQLADLRRQAEGRSIVLCHGCFDIVHPGHVRYLQFARSQGDVLVVSLTGDDAIEKADGMRPYVPQELRAESLAALEFVDQVVVVESPTAEPVIAALKPDVYVKGKEYEASTDPRFLEEKRLVEAGGGRVIHSSGDVVFSSSALIESLAPIADPMGEKRRLAACCARWGIDAGSMRRAISGGFAGKKVAVVGDAMLDHYVFCDSTNVAGEAPILSVRPLEEASYLGGAAIIAAHLKALGAEPHLITTVADDAPSRELIDRLERLRIERTALAIRKSLPTKQRYLVETQKLLKVDRASPQPLDTATQRRAVGALADLAAGGLDAAIFADFGYGVISGSLLDEAASAIRSRTRVISGDVSGPRRSMLAMRQFDLLAPTEREMRGVLGDFEQSLPTVAGQLMQTLGVGNLAVTMGPRGCVLFRPREQQREQWFHSRLRSEYLPALAPHAVDPVGAGDAFLSVATLMLAAGGTLNQAGYLGSAAAAIAVSRLGNVPVTRQELAHWLGSRPELASPSLADAG
jgi:rfaE bifunctional protein kinase chain/domain/rfaE bifunctional protein nucleotidyltransferase chain/domain